MAGEAFRLVIPQDMLNKLQAADDKLKSLGNTSENTRNRVTQAFGKMTGGVQAFINKLNEAQQRLDNLSNFKGANINLGNVVTRDSVANIDKLIEAINQLSQKGQAKITINGIDATANQAVVAVDSINKLIDTLVKLQQMGGQNFTATTNLLGKETLKQMNSEARKMSKTIDKLDEATQRYASTAGNLSDKIRQAREAQRQFNEEAKRAAQTNVGDLMSGRGKATTLNELKAYANQLKTTMANLDPKSKEWQNLNRILQETNKDIQRINESMGAVRKTQSNLMNHAQQLRRALALVFSVSQITGYINKMIQVRGEFELQQRSLQAILQNKDEADKLWQQTVDFAVRSPFRVKELVSYTKQLAAYRVETEKLHETTKMLSDVSAGLGVDMQRLILAFGQVKAANYLRGTELRQFSEAGINILGELAKYFTELEGRAVSVGEVFERVSKRMVAFSDVEEIFKRVTSEGGVFYRMQEIQSETVKGLISNLYDQVDLMLNDIGKSNDGALKGAIGLVKSLVENWKYVAEAIKIAGAAWLVYKVQAQLAHEKNMLLAIDFGILTDASQKQLKFTQLLALSWKRVTLAVKTFTKALIANPIILAITAALYAATKLYSAWSKHQEQLEEITKQYKELRKEVTDISVKFTYASNIEEQKKELSKLIGVAKDKYNLNVDIDVKGLDEQEVSEKFNNLRNEILNTMAFTEQMSKAIVESDAWYKWGDDIYGAFEKFSKSAQEYSNVIRNNKNAIVDFLTETGRFDDVAKEFFAERGEYVKNETELEYIERLTLAYKLYYKEIVRGGKIFGANGLIQRPTEEVEALIKAASEYVKAKEDAVEEFDEFAKDFNIPSILTEENKTAYVKTAIDQQGFDDFTREMWYKLANERFSVNITPKAVAPTELEDWAVRVTDAIKEVNAKIKKENPNIEDNQLFPLPKVGQTKEQYLALAKDVIDIAEATYTKNQQIVEDEEVARTNLLKDYAKTYKDILNIETKNKTNKKEQEAIRLMNERISLIKEMHKEYQKLREEYDHATSQQKVLNAYAKTFTQLFGDLDVNLMGSLIDSEALSRLKETGEIAVDVANKLEELAASGTHIRNFDEAFVESLKELESFRANAYNLGDGVWTIGFGETKGVKQGDTITKEEADAKLRQRLTQDFVKELNNVLDVNKDLILTQEQYNALLDLTYQGGASSVRQLINMAKNVESSVSYVEKLKEKIGGVLGEETAARFGEDFVKKLRESENIYQRIALLLQTMNLTVNNGKISKELYKGLQSRSDKRAALFATGKSVSDILASVTKEFSSLDISTKQGVVAFLKSLEPIAKQEGEKVAQALQQSIDGFEAEIGLDIQIQENKRIERELESLFGSYEISMELDKLNIPKDAMKSLFGVEPIELPEVRVKGLEKVGLGSMANLTDEAILASQAYKDLNEKQQKDLAEHLKKVAKMEQKEQEERLKKYIAFSRKAMSERAKIKFEELQTIAEIEKAFAIREGDSEDVKATKRDEEAKAKAKAKKDANDALQKLDWEDFKSSDTFNNIFDDLEHASDEVLKKVINRLKDFKAQWKDMPFDQMRQVVDLLQKAEEALKESDNPFTEAKRLKKAIKKDGRSKEQAQLDVYNAEQQKAINEQALANYELFEKVANKQIAATTLSTEQLKEYVEWQNKSVDAQRMLVEGKKIENAELDKAIQKGNTQQNNIKKLTDVYKKQEDSINQINKLTQDLYGSFMDLAENGASLFGKELDDTTKIFADMGASMADTVMQTVALYINLKSVETGAYAAGTALNTAMGVIGWIVMAVQLLSQALKAVVQAHDNKQQKQIEEEAKKVERLQKTYEDLKETIDNTYDLGTLQQSTDIAKRNIEEQIHATERMIKAEDDKKNSDQDAIDGYKDEIEELKKSYKELEETRLQELGAFATDENKKSGAEAFLDAWMEAYKETGNGLSGLNEQFDEFFEDSVKRQMLQKVTSSYLENLFNKYDSAIQDWADGELSDEELYENLSGLRNDLPALNEALEKWAEAVGISAEFAGKNAELSGLSAGIQGITAEQADVLASYWNSVRFYTADTNAKFTDLITRLFDSEGSSNPMLAELRAQTAFIQEIRDVLGSVVGRGGTTHSGAFLKVAIG